MFPHPTLFPCPCGSVPLKLAGAARAPGAANVISPSEGVHARSAQQCGFGRGVASGPQVSVALPRSPPCCANREPCGCCGGSCCGRAAQEPSKVKAVAVFRVPPGERGSAPAHPLSRPHLIETTAHPFAPPPGHRTRPREMDNGLSAIAIVGPRPLIRLGPGEDPREVPPNGGYGDQMATASPVTKIVRSDKANARAPACGKVSQETQPSGAHVHCRYSCETGRAFAANVRNADVVGRVPF
jgi:hypothetical protein